MRQSAEYVLEWPAGGAAELAPAVFDRVWRRDFGPTGFCLIPLPSSIDSYALRAMMLGLIAAVSTESERRTRKRFVYRSAGRFDQQLTTKFHLDGAPDESLLVLGYEPSRVTSRLALADFTRCAFDLGIPPRRFLTEFNPMYPVGAARLAPYVTALTAFESSRPQILLINNSSVPFSPDGTNPLGVMHQAEIPEPLSTERRVVNSVMLAASRTDPDALDAAALAEFVRTDRISQQY
jgi:hypothetical protein